MRTLSSSAGPSASPLLISSGVNPASTPASTSSARPVATPAAIATPNAMSASESIARKTRSQSAIKRSVVIRPLPTKRSKAQRSCMDLVINEPGRDLSAGVSGWYARTRFWERTKLLQVFAWRHRFGEQNSDKHYASAVNQLR
ncbi:hypothetical protein PPTG_23220 [Phytophthora nicotianae INRA-310]|uniref:Uncharacterized protein n=2 Tax=Phytophthora nicotianae TaxID=4792 RepID=W2Q4B9_PHYN3|nr:hypothetical protein PPTG_23220 [Phytophthora nicotianae INRA-310]ETN07110.1 hypothetical protein PPTG_23220 [Phytophthora nicotianae INRA-310]ETO58413.1 hypothetical protein F444_23210 [Phytophthora nicotianae P1976]